jgi:hypothetical protein
VSQNSAHFGPVWGATPKDTYGSDIHKENFLRIVFQLYLIVESVDNTVLSEMEPGVQFEPSPAVPALQFFEGVDMSGMAMKAGLRPGDFLLQINGVDVRRASHDQVVDLIQQADDTITLKVITIDANRFVAGTMPARRTRGQFFYYYWKNLVRRFLNPFQVVCVQHRRHCVSAC